MTSFAASDPKIEPITGSPAVKTPRTRVRFPLVLKLYIVMAILIAAVVAISIGITITRAQSIANRTVNESISSAAKLFKDLELNRLRVLSLGVFTLTRDSTFYAYIESALHPQPTLIPGAVPQPGRTAPPVVDLTDILDQLQQRREVLGSDLLILTDDQGIVVARAGDEAAHPPGEDMYTTQPIVKQSIDSGSIEPVGGVILSSGRLYHAAVAPMSVGANSIRLGYLVNAKAIDEKFANQIAGTTHAEVVFIPKHGGRDTVPVPRSSNAPSVDGVIAMSEIQEIFNGGHSIPPHSAKIDRSSYVLTGEPLSSDGKPVGAAVFVRSTDRELAPFRQIERSVLGAGGLALLVAFAIAWVLAKRMTRPIEDLAGMAEAVTAGDYSVRPRTDGTDEVGILASSFAQMISALRDKAELEKLYEQMSSRTGAGRAQLPAGSVPTVRLGDTASAITLHHRHELSPGAVFASRYNIEQILGRGGMGIVYKAVDQQLDETVAIKTLPGDVMARSPEDLERFKREIRLARKITHRNVLRTYDYGEAEGVYFISMEYVRGYTLAELLAETPQTSMRVAMGIARQICRGLQAAHEQGIIHRDIKPQNVLIDHKGEVKLMDFGIARMAEADVMTQQGLIVGTPHYMSPEQVQGKQLDARSDVYSMGVVIYEMLCGVRPFDAPSLTAVLAAHITQAPQAPQDVRPEIGSEINAIVLKCLAKDPRERFADAGELLAALDRLQRAPGGANAAA